MERNYLRKSGTTIFCFVYDTRFVEIMNPKNHKTIARVDIKEVDGQKVFDYDGERFYVDNFLFNSLDILIKQVDTGVELGDRWYVDRDYALCTIMKEYHKLGIIMPVREFDTFIPVMGLGIKSSDSKEIDTIMVPFEHRFKKDEWSYKIEFHAMYDDERFRVGIETMYFEDFWSSVMSGRYRLINIEGLPRCVTKKVRTSLFDVYYVNNKINK